MTEMLKTSETTEKLLKFIDASPSCFHAVKNICVMLEDAGCIRLLENETWTLEKGKRYFTTRNGSSVLASVSYTHLFGISRSVKKQNPAVWLLISVRIHIRPYV